MPDAGWVRQQAAVSLGRLWPRLEACFQEQRLAQPEEWRTFEARLRCEWERLFDLLVELYGEHYDFFFHLEVILTTAARSWLARPGWLKQLDARREAAPDWFQSQQMVGGVCYVDRFAETLAGLRAHLPYFQELGLTYLHLMPLFEAPSGNSDGGYAVSSYRRVDPQLGTIEELSALACEFQAHGISLVLDFVFNHTSDEHEWARLAQAGDMEHQGYYFLFPDRTLPDAYEQTLRDIFPTVRRGSFTWREDIRQWVWTTFNSYTYASDSAQAGDSRWVHRPKVDWEQRRTARQDLAAPFGRVWAELTRLIHLRKAQPAIWDGEMEVIESGDPHLFGFVRHHDRQRLLVVANFSEHQQAIDANRVRVYGLGYHFTDLISGLARTADGPLRLEPYQCVWLEAR
ncbi:MAG: alpha-amylase family glycosyl hydrolase [Roseiflexaceae bacterium]